MSDWFNKVTCHLYANTEAQLARCCLPISLLMGSGAILGLQAVPQDDSTVPPLGRNCWHWHAG
jgi:hypothetical protein